LKLDGHPYSATLLERIVLMAGTAGSSEEAATALQVVGELRISARTVTKLTAEIGGQMVAAREARVDQYLEQPLPRKPTEVSSPPQLAAVYCDGGRMRTRAEGGGHGVHRPHWRETKNAAFHRMQSRARESDPQPDLPECFRNQSYVEKLVLGLKKAKQPERELVSAVSADEPPTRSQPAEAAEDWQPKTLVRTCLSSLVSSDEFGPRMAVEADARGFYAAAKRAFLGDGQAYNWTIQRKWFGGFTPIADFIHVVEYVYEAAKAIEDNPVSRWRQYVSWANACWQGKVDEVIEDLRRHLPQSTEDVEPADEGATETERAIRRAGTYLTNNRTRMEYPRYRREGLPVTSSLAESLVKQIGKRVKGTEKFWDDGASGEAILQVRAAVISQDGRLAKFFRERPISPYSPRCRIPTPAATP
jgi:hypothetical protein